MEIASLCSSIISGKKLRGGGSGWVGSMTLRHWYTLQLLRHRMTTGICNVHLINTISLKCEIKTTINRVRCPPFNPHSTYSSTQSPKHIDIYVQTKQCTSVLFDGIFVRGKGWMRYLDRMYGGLKMEPILLYKSGRSFQKTWFFNLFWLNKNYGEWFRSKSIVAVVNYTYKKKTPKNKGQLFFVERKFRISHSCMDQILDS